VRREALTNPTGPAPVDESFAEQLAPNTATAEPGGHADESVPASDDKAMRSQLTELDAGELARLAVLEPGALLEQGSTYLDLNDLSCGPFKAIGGQEASPDHCYVAKRDTDYELWNRLAGDRDAGVERPGT